VDRHVPETILSSRNKVRAKKLELLVHPVGAGASITATSGANAAVLPDLMDYRRTEIPAKAPRSLLPHEPTFGPSPIWPAGFALHGWIRDPQATNRAWRETDLMAATKHPWLATIASTENQAKASTRRISAMGASAAALRRQH
jgi:hypothetical protein